MGKIMIPTEDNYLLSISYFKSDIENAAGIVQIVHGMEEHKERYYDFALFLAEKGLNVVVSDLRATGRTHRCSLILRTSGETGCLSGTSS